MAWSQSKSTNRTVTRVGLAPITSAKKQDNLGRWDEGGDTWQVVQMVRQWMTLHQQQLGSEWTEQLNEMGGCTAAQLLDKLGKFCESLGDPTAPAAPAAAVDSTAAAARDITNR